MKKKYIFAPDTTLEFFTYHVYLAEERQHIIYNSVYTTIFRLSKPVNATNIPI